MATTTPRGPRAHPILGHLLELKRDWLGTLTRYAREYGDFVPLRVGPKRVVLLSHPEYVEQVMVAQRRSFIKDPAVRLGRRLLGDGILTSEDDEWLFQRRLMQPAFHRSRLAGYAELMVATTERTLATWREDRDFDMLRAMMRLTLEIVAQALFGTDVAGEAAEVAAALEVAAERASERLTSLLFLLPDTIPTPGNRAYLRAARRLDELIYGIIERRRRSDDDSGDLLTLLLRARDEDDGRLSDKQLRDSVMTLVLAGHGTTATALAWTWYLLAQHPAVEAALAAELRAVGDRRPTLGDLPRLTYTEAIFTEALRLYPPVWATGREARRDCQLGGTAAAPAWPIRSGTIVVMSQWVLQRDPRFFERPDEFVPERWLDGLAKRLPKFAYFPFGGGPRICMGNAFAMMEAVLILATIAQQARPTLVPGQSITPWPTAALRPRPGVRMVPLRRAPVGQA